MITDSKYQADIYNWIPNGSGSLVVEAVAGSGKTTTLATICRKISPMESVRVFMFNRDISETFKARVSRSNVIISTYNSAGYQALLRHYHAKVDVEKHKTSSMLREVLDQIDYKAYGEPLRQLISLAKGTGIGCLAGGEAWGELIDHHDIEFDWLIPPRTPERELEACMVAERQRVLQLARDLLLASNDAAQQQFEWRIDYDDQLYLPILWDLPLPTYDWVLVDELQDTNAIQREILKRSLAPGGRLIGVGDRHQAIYAWRGASTNAMDLVRADFDADEKPLSVCYRCGRVIIEKAQGIVPQIEAAPGGHLGEVLQDVPLARLATLTAQDAILCRNNAPLVKTGYQLIAQGVGVQIIGRDVGEGLKTLIYKLKARTVEELETALDVYRAKEVKRYRTQKQESRAAGVEDRVQCLHTVIEALDTGERTIERVLLAVTQLFGEGEKDLLTLSTVHKAKGREWPTVAIIRADLMPSFFAQSGWQLEQEHHLQYVAWTRAQQRLWFMDDKPEWLRKKEAKERGDDQTEERRAIGHERGSTENRWNRNRP